MKEYIPLMSEEVLGERLDPSEATTTIALTHAMPFEFRRDEYGFDEIEQWSKSIIRTGAIYVVEHEQMIPNWDMMFDLPMLLPPLPFPRVVIEAERDGKPIGFTWRTDDERRQEIFSMNLMVILEVERGRKWHVSFAIEFQNQNQFFLFELASSSDKGFDVRMPKVLGGPLEVVDEDSDKGFELMAGMFSKYVVQCAHLITAKNVPKIKLDLPRSQRKTWKRKFRQDPPTVYRVKLSEAGDKEGTAGWHYKVRFLVQGNWQHWSKGKEFCTCCNPPRIASWREPYIKGPAGAPWKGRPVHEKETE